jgi:hypothetical protein
MKHIHRITKTMPAPAESLLQWTQKAAIFGSFASGLRTLAEAWGTYSEVAAGKGGSNGE